MPLSGQFYKDQVLSCHYQDCSIKTRYSHATVRTVLLRPSVLSRYYQDCYIKTRYSHSTILDCSIGPGTLLPLLEMLLRPGTFIPLLDCYRKRYSSSAIRTVLFKARLPDSVIQTFLETSVLLASMDFFIRPVRRTHGLHTRIRAVVESYIVSELYFIQFKSYTCAKNKTRLQEKYQPLNNPSSQ